MFFARTADTGLKTVYKTSWTLEEDLSPRRDGRGGLRKIRRGGRAELRQTLERPVVFSHRTPEGDEMPAYGVRTLSRRRDSYALTSSVRGVESIGSTERRIESISFSTELSWRR